MQIKISYPNFLLAYLSTYYTAVSIYPIDDIGREDDFPLISAPTIYAAFSIYPIEDIGREDDFSVISAS